MSSGPISTWSNADKITETIRRSKKHLGPALGQQVDALLSPENMTIMTATLVIWAGSHFFGVGEVVDVVLLLVGAALLGPAVVDVAENLIKFGQCINANTQEDLERGAKAFADAAIKGGIAVIMAILLRRGAKGLEASRAPGIASPSWLQLAKPGGPKGLPTVGPDPSAGKLWSKLPAPVADPKMAAGSGKTAGFGETWYSAQGTATEQQLALLHELVHRFFSPRLGILRTLRTRLRWGSYSKSVVLRYLEEALAETYAQLRVNGFKGLLAAIRFPVEGGYMSLSELAAEGQAIGTIIVGSQRFSVSLVNGPPKWAEEARKSVVRASQAGKAAVTDGLPVPVTPGASLSSIAKARYGDFNLWPLIYDLNKDTIGSNPNLVKAGTILVLLPIERYTATEIAEARKRAPIWKSYPR